MTGEIRLDGWRMWLESARRTALALAIFLSAAPIAVGDSRELVQLPEMMQDHMMANMRDHLVAINEILLSLGANEMDKAAEIAEQRLGMSSLDAHGASHMAEHMPVGMRELGENMHRAASRFALKAEEGEPLAAYGALSEVTTACVRCHSRYRIR